MICKPEVLERLLWGIYFPFNPAGWCWEVCFNGVFQAHYLNNYVSGISKWPLPPSCYLEKEKKSLLQGLCWLKPCFILMSTFYSIAILRIILLIVSTLSSVPLILQFVVLQIECDFYKWWIKLIKGGWWISWWWWCYSILNL